MKKRQEWHIPMVSTLLLMGHFGIQVYADISKNMSELVVTIL